MPSRPPAGNRVSPVAVEDNPRQDGTDMSKGALLSDITKGKALKKAVTNDRSAPQLAGGSGGVVSSAVGGAPAVPKAPGGLAPPVPAGNRARSNSDQSGRESTPMDQPPQLAGLFAGGMPKLKKRGGGVDTGGMYCRTSLLHGILIM